MSYSVGWKTNTKYNTLIGMMDLFLGIAYILILNYFIISMNLCKTIFKICFESIFIDSKILASILHPMIASQNPNQHFAVFSLTSWFTCLHNCIYLCVSIFANRFPVARVFNSKSPNNSASTNTLALCIELHLCLNICVSCVSGALRIDRFTDFIAYKLCVCVIGHTICAIFKPQTKPHGFVQMCL